MSAQHNADHAHHRGAAQRFDPSDDGYDFFPPLDNVATVMRKAMALVQKLTVYLSTGDNEAKVVERLNRLASGEMPMVETITPEEEAMFRMLCGVIATIGPLNMINLLMPKQSNPPPEGSMPEVTLGFLLKAAIRLIAEAGGPQALVERLGSFTRREMTRMAVLVMAYVYYEGFHYPQPELGKYDIAGDDFQKVKWVYRYWLNQLEVAERGSGMEAHFEAQTLDAVRYPIEDEERVVLPQLGSLSITCAGDLLAVDVLTPKNTPHLFDDIVDFYSNADIVSANLESTVDSSKPIGRDQTDRTKPAKMNTSQAMFDKFRYDAKINYFSTATNHAMDYGEGGVLATLDVLKRSGAYYSGTAASQAEQDDVLVVDKNGVKVALLSYTFDLNGYCRGDKKYLVNVVRFNDAKPAPDYSLIRRQVASAKAKGADWIIAYVHWGWEFEMYPHVNIRQAARDVIDCGVDTIFGNHAHVSQPAELIPRGESKQPALVIYAFGDFVSYHPESRNSKIAYAIKMNIVKYMLPGGTGGDDTFHTFVVRFQALPLYIVNSKEGQAEEGKFNCRIVKFFDVLADPDNAKYGLTALEKSQLPHLHEEVWNKILAPLARNPPISGHVSGQPHQNAAQKQHAAHGDNNANRSSAHASCATSA